MITTERNVQYVFSILSRGSAMAGHDAAVGLRDAAASGGKGDGSNNVNTLGTSTQSTMHVNILDTLHYQHGSLRSWYYADETTGEVLKRDRRECSKERILEVFGEGVGASCPVAIYLHHCAPGWQAGGGSGGDDGAPPPRMLLGAESRRSSTYLAQHRRQEEAQREREDPDPMTTNPSVVSAKQFAAEFSDDAYPIAVDYFDRDKLEGFLETRDNKHDVLVQRFVDGGKINDNFSTIEAVWSPYQLYLNQRQAVVSVKQVDVPLQTRCHTFDNDALFNRPLRTTTQMRSRVKRECEKIVQQIKLVEHKSVIRMVAYFAITRDNAPVLLWCPELQMMDSPQQLSADASTPSAAKGNRMAGGGGVDAAASMLERGMASTSQQQQQNGSRAASASKKKHQTSRSNIMVVDDEEEGESLITAADTKASANKMSLQRQRQLLLISPPIVPSDVRLPKDWQSQLKGNRRGGGFGSGGGGSPHRDDSSGGRHRGPTSRVTALKGIPRVGRRNIGFDGVAAMMASGGPTASLCHDAEIPTVIASAIAHKRSVDQQLAMLDATFPLSKAATTPSCQLDRQRRVASVAYAGGLGSRPQSRTGGELLLLSSPNDRRQLDASGVSSSPTRGGLNGSVATVLADPHGTSKARGVLNSFGQLPEGSSPIQERALSSNGHRPPMPIAVGSVYHTDILGQPVAGAAARRSHTSHASSGGGGGNSSAIASGRPASALLDYSLTCGFSSKGASMLIDPFAAEAERRQQVNRARDRSANSKKFYHAAGASANQFTHLHHARTPQPKGSPSMGSDTNVLALSAMRGGRGVTGTRASSAGPYGPNNNNNNNNNNSRPATMRSCGAISHNPSQSDHYRHSTEGFPSQISAAGGDQLNFEDSAADESIGQIMTPGGRGGGAPPDSMGDRPLSPSSTSPSGGVVTSRDQFWGDKERVFSRGGGGGYFVRRVRSSARNTAGSRDSGGSPSRPLSPLVPTPTMAAQQQHQQQRPSTSPAGTSLSAVDAFSRSVIRAAAGGGATTAVTGGGGAEGIVRPLSPPRLSASLIGGKGFSSPNGSANAPSAVAAEESLAAAAAEAERSKIAALAADVQRYQILEAARRRLVKEREEGVLPKGAAGTPAVALLTAPLPPKDTAAVNVNWNVLLEQAMYSRWLRLDKGTGGVYTSSGKGVHFGDGGDGPSFSFSTSSPLRAASVARGSGDAQQHSAHNTSASVDDSSAASAGGAALHAPYSASPTAASTAAPSSSSPDPTAVLNAFIKERMGSNGVLNLSVGGSGSSAVAFPSTNPTSGALSLLASPTVAGSKQSQQQQQQPMLAHLDHPLVLQQARHTRLSLGAFAPTSMRDASLLWDVDLFSDADAASNALLWLECASVIDRERDEREALARDHKARLDKERERAQLRRRSGGGGGGGNNSTDASANLVGGAVTPLSGALNSSLTSITPLKSAVISPPDAAAGDDAIDPSSPTATAATLSPLPLLPPPPPFPTEQLQLLDRSFLVIGGCNAVVKRRRIANVGAVASSMMDATLPQHLHLVGGGNNAYSGNGNKGGGSTRNKGGGRSKDSSSGRAQSPPYTTVAPLAAGVSSPYKQQQQQLPAGANPSSISIGAPDTVVQQRFVANLWDLFDPQLADGAFRGVMGAHKRYLAAIDALIGKLQRDFYGSAGMGGGSDFVECGNVPIHILLTPSNSHQRQQQQQEGGSVTTDDADDDGSGDDATALLQFPPLVVPMLLDALLLMLPHRKAAPHARAFLEPFMLEMRRIIIGGPSGGASGVDSAGRKRGAESSPQRSVSPSAAAASHSPTAGRPASLLSTLVGGGSTARSAAASLSAAQPSLSAAVPIGGGLDAAKATIEGCRGKTEALQQLGLDCIQQLLLVSEEEEDAERERRRLVKLFQQQQQQQQSSSSGGRSGAGTGASSINEQRAVAFTTTNGESASNNGAANDPSPSSAVPPPPAEPTEGPMAFKMACLTDYYEKMKAANTVLTQSTAARRKSSVNSNTNNNQNNSASAPAKPMYPDVFNGPPNTFTFLCHSSVTLHHCIAALGHIASMIEVSMVACELHSLLDIGERLEQQVARLEELRKIRKVRLKKLEQEAQRAAAMAALQQQQGGGGGLLAAGKAGGGLLGSGGAVGGRKASSLQHAGSTLGSTTNGGGGTIPIIPAGYVLVNGQLVRPPSATETQVPPLVLFNPSARFAYDWPNAVFAGRAVTSQHLQSVPGGGVIPLALEAMGGGGGGGDAGSSLNATANSATATGGGSPAVSRQPSAQPQQHRGLGARHHQQHQEGLLTSLYDGEDDEPHLSATHLQFVALLIREKVHSRLVDARASDVVSTMWPPQLVLF